MGGSQLECLSDKKQHWAEHTEACPAGAPRVGPGTMPQTLLDASQQTTEQSSTSANGPLPPPPANDHNSQVSLSPCPPSKRVAGYVIRGVCLTAASFHLGPGSLVGLKDIPNTRPGAPGLGQVGTTGGGWPCAQSSEGSQPAPPPSRGALQRAGGTRGGGVRLWPARDPPIVRGQAVGPNATFTAETTVVSTGDRGWRAAAGSSGWGARAWSRPPLTEEKEAWPDPGPWTSPLGPVLGGAQDSLQVLGQRADDRLDVQLCPL